jgi:hypothetical protein
MASGLVAFIHDKTPTTNKINNNQPSQTLSPRPTPNHSLSLFLSLSPPIDPFTYFCFLFSASPNHINPNTNFFLPFDQLSICTYTNQTKRIIKSAPRCAHLHSSSSFSSSSRYFEEEMTNTNCHLQPWLHLQQLARQKTCAW